jgi:hypothetical protein
MAALGFCYRSSTFNNVIADGATVTMPWPLSDIAEGNVDQTNAQVVVGGNILADGEYTLVFDEPSAGIAVTNGTGKDWLPQTDVVVCAPHKFFPPGPNGPLVTAIINHEQRIEALEGGAAPSPAPPVADAPDAATRATVVIPPTVKKGRKA